MAKQLNVDLNFRADTSQAKQALSELNTALRKLQTMPTSLFDDTNLKKASQAAMELQSHLQKAVNVDTGKLDLSRLSQSMQSSQKDLNHYYQTLTKVGPAGQQAFLALSKSIANADTATLKMSSRMSEFATTLKNTARWQISSSILHGFMGTLQSAYGYAQDLNESLNNIRIVTGKSIADMDAFADRANRAAKSLSTTTTAYTDAALIFYQQGLSDDEVTERTNATIKMAHAAGESAAEVSSYMTAIWNNFDDGSKSLEYYGDVMASLGAKTAASSAEIAEGLEKFASVGETIGLSYEYATAAVATIVDKTRQSADTVGTALKTIFARLQGLELGETLEDGVNLNKYSTALETVGVEVLDLNGNLRQADDIIADLGARWGELGTAQQTALAQTVAGTRQYTQLMALMNNYDAFQENVAIAEGAEGTLQEQADIYAESWEAARDRVKAAAQEIYGDLLDDDFFIAFLNGFEKVLSGIGDVIDGVGGLKGVLLIVGSIFMRQYAKEIPQALQNLAANFGVITGEAQKAAQKLQQDNQSMLKNMQDSARSNGGYKSFAMEGQVESLSIVNQMTAELADKQNLLSKAELEQYQNRIKNVSAIGEQLVKEGELLDKTQKLTEEKKKQLAFSARKKDADGQVLTGGKDRRQARTEATTQLADMQNLYKEYAKLQGAMEGIKKQSSVWSTNAKNIQSNSAEAKKLSSSMKEYASVLQQSDLKIKTESFDALNQALDKADGNIDEIMAAWIDFEKQVADGELNAAIEQTDGKFENIRTALNDLGISGSELDKLEAEFEEAGFATEEFRKKIAALRNGVQEPITHTVKLSESFGHLASTLMNVSSLLTAFKNLGSIWNNDDISTGEKITQTISALGMVIMSVTGILNKNTLAHAANLAAAIASALGWKTEAAAASIAAGATATLGVVLSSVLLPIALVAAAIAGLVVIITALVNKLNEPTEAEANLMKAEDAASSAKSAFEDATTAAEELNAALDQYDSVYATFQDCTIGTQEWRDAMQELNEEVTNLINQYPDLKLETDPITGGLSINQESMDNARANATRRVNAAMVNNVLAGADAAQARVDANLEDIDENVSIPNLPPGLGVNFDKGFIDAIKVGDIDLNTSVEDQVNAAIEHAIQLVQEEAEQKAEATGKNPGDKKYEKAKKQALTSSGLFDNDGNVISEDNYMWGLIRNSLKDAFSDEDVVKSMENYSQAIQDADLQIQNAFSVLTSSLLNEREDLNAAEKKLAAKYVEDDIEVRKQELIEEDSAHAKGQENDASVYNIWNRYLAATGKNWSLQDNAIKENDERREYAYIDENGAEQTVKFTDMAAVIASYEALENVNEAANKAAESLNGLQNLDENLKQGLTDYFASGELHSLSEKSLNEVQGKLAIDNNGNASKESIDSFLMESFGVNSAEELGVLLGETYYEDFNRAQKEYAYALKDFSSKIPEGVEEAFNELDSEDLSLSGKESVLNLVKEAMLQGGYESRDTIKEMLENMSPEDLNQFSTALSNIDWDTVKIDDLEMALKRVGLSADDLGIDLYALVDAMKKTEATTLQITQEKYKAVNDIVKGLNIGDTIDAEQYSFLSESLGEAGEELMDGFFSVMADGTYQLSADAEAFYQLVQKAPREQFVENIKQGRELSTSLSNTTADEMNSGEINSAPTADAAMAYLSSLELEEEELISLRQAQEEFNKTGEYTAQTYEILNGLMSEHQITEEQIKGLVEQNTLAIQGNAESLLSTATSLQELQGLGSLVAEQLGGNMPGYSEALINLATNYDNCAEEIETYQMALLNGNEEQATAALSALELSVSVGEAAAKFGLGAKETENYAKRLSSSMGISGQEAVKLAVANQRLDRGLTSLNKNLKNYQKGLKENARNSADWSKTMDSLKEDLSDMLNLADGNMLSDGFAEAVIESEDFEAALGGDVEALKRLQTLAADDIMVNIVANQSTTETPEQIKSRWEQLKADFEATNIESPDVNQDKLLNSFNEMIRAGNMTKEQIEAALAGLHVSANVKTTYVSQKQQVPLTVTETSWLPAGTMTVPVPDGDGGTKDETYTSMRRVTRTYDAGVSEADVVVPQYEIEGTEGEGGLTTAFTAAPTPSASKSATTPSNTGGNNKGSGSPKSETKEKNNEKRKDSKDEKERYRVIKNQIEDLTAIYKNLSGAKDKAFGGARLKAINKEIDAQKKLTDANKTYLNQIKAYLDQDKGDVISAAKSLGKKAEFDENGTLTNYDELVEKAVKKYNKAVKEFNSHTTDDKSAQDAFTKAQEDYEEFMKILDQYDETHDLWLEQMQTVLDDIMHEQELQLEKTQYEVELKINVSDDSLKYLEYVLENIEDKAYDCAEAFAYLNEMTSIYEQDSETYKKGIYDIFANKGFTEEEVDALVNGDENVYDKVMKSLSSGGQANLKDGLDKDEIDAAYGFTADDVDAIRENVDGLLSTNQALEDLREQVHDQILIAWDELNQKMDDGISKMEHLQSITQSYQNIIDIVGQKNLGVSDAFMTKMEQQATTQARDKVAATKARKDAAEESLKEARATFKAQKDKGILSPEEIKQWEDTIRKMEEDTQAAAEAFQAAWEESLTAAQAQFEASVERMIKAYDDAAAGLMGSMAELQEMFDRKSDISKQYLADYEKIYQISKLNRELDKSIDSTTDVKAKQELLELQSKINAYEEAGVQISEYQMEQLRQEYELKKAQIELEESQSAKSEVQMTRDAEGNYSYVYTANDDDVSKAEQNYEDKLHAMQESNANYINDLQSNMIQLEQDYQGKVQEIMLDTSLTAEERMSKLNELNEYYDQKMQFYMSEAKLWQENSCRLYEQDWTSYAAATGYKISSEEQWLDHWEETQLAVLTGFGSLEEYYANHNNNVATLLLTSAQNLATWQGNVEEAMKAAGTSVAGFQTTAEETLGKVAEDSKKAQEEVVSTAQLSMEKMGEVIGAVAKWENSYSESVGRILLKNKALIKSFNKVIKGWSKYTDATGSGDEEEGDPPKNNNEGDPPKKNDEGDPPKNNDNGGKPKWSRVLAAYHKINNGAWGNGIATRIAKGKADGFTKAEVEAGQKLINYTYDVSLKGAGKSMAEAKKLMGYDTGGYTGAWGDAAGKLALLHEKEIVLNKDDTANFLKTVEIVRQISDMIDLNAMTSAGGLNSLFAATSSNLTNTLQQEVTIHAEFPNATDKDQITEAFSDLINLASQYANRKL